MIGDNGDGDILLTGIRTGSNLYKLQIKAIIPGNEVSYAYQVSNAASTSDTAISKPSNTQAAETSQQGEISSSEHMQMNNIEVWHHHFCHIISL